VRSAIFDVRWTIHLFSPRDETNSNHDSGPTSPDFA
jgi:hypothetical protein